MIESEKREKKGKKRKKKEEKMKKKKTSSKLQLLASLYGQEKSLIPLLKKKKVCYTSFSLCSAVSRVCVDYGSRHGQ